MNDYLNDSSNDTFSWTTNYEIVNLNDNSFSIGSKISFARLLVHVIKTNKKPKLELRV